METPLSKQHLIKLNQTLAKISEGFQVADMMEAAGVDASELKATLRYYQEELAKRKGIHFPTSK